VIVADLLGSYFYSEVITIVSVKVIIVSCRIIWSWYTGRWWVECYIRYSEEGTGWWPILTVRL